jgi:hypothetical protein
MDEEESLPSRVFMQTAPVILERPPSWGRGSLTDYGAIFQEGTVIEPMFLLLLGFCALRYRRAQNIYAIMLPSWNLAPSSSRDPLPHEGGLSRITGAA